MASTDLRIGYWLSSEEHPAPALVEHAVAAEDAGFETAMISDHFHPWTPTQGRSSFVWSVLGAIAHGTSELEVGTGVTAMVHRFHPALIAQAAATMASLMPGRFFLGVGTGERLNEQITGERWPRAGERREMLAEAVDLIRRLWTGRTVNHRGLHFAVENAQLFTRPDQLPPLLIAAGGARSAKLDGEIADGLICVEPDPRLVEAFEATGGAGRRKVAQLHVCVAPDEEEARRTAHRWWPNAAIAGGALSDLARPDDFEALAGLVGEDAVADKVVCGPDPVLHLDAIRRFVGAGFDTVYVHQIGPDQQALFKLYQDEVMPAL